MGHTIDKDGIHVDNSKIRVIQQMSAPTTKKELKRFLGAVGYVRRFIKHFAKIASPLTDLTKDKTQWSWSNECQSAFIQLKEALVSPPVLILPDFSKTFYLSADASDHAVGACLMQNQGHGL